MSSTQYDVEHEDVVDAVEKLAEAGVATTKLMLRELGAFRRYSNAGNTPTSDSNDENLPVDPSDLQAPQLESDPSRPPLQTIQEVVKNARPVLDQGAILRRKTETTPSKNHSKVSDQSHLPFRTPEKMVARYRFDWNSKAQPGLNAAKDGDDSNYHVSSSQLPPVNRGGRLGLGGGHGSNTPRTHRATGKASSVRSDGSSTHSTPAKSVMKLGHSGFSNSRAPMSVGTRTMSFSTPSRGIHISSTLPAVVNSAEVPHFELKEDQSFWMDNNVQVVIRVRPLNSTEKNLQGFRRCLKQQSAHNITWIGQPETQFKFDYVACETIDQEMLFRVAGLPMVENCMSGYNSCVFAYGQTGSGKTYTMLGETEELELRPSPSCGMTPRIFEFLFARIKAEEESRRDEKLKYSCRCSFLEIYNEQIIDLLDPSSSNLLLREDISKGVYVENLTDYVVENATDVIKLLIRGAANRKVASTTMNHESSRSHTVFTCVIESGWEKDLTVNIRTARLNLVDLAGSERQKSSGAEGERLKEAASINKSLSTLGHVIMVLADVAHGKQRHVPYRDSRLTFLLQDSLGGNSKTMIIANVSPSLCSANETLSTLRFAQRARLIQNNAVVNEDASEDIIALRHQIHLLKDELLVLKRQNVSRSLSLCTTVFEDSKSKIRDAPIKEKQSEVVDVNADELQSGEALESARLSLKQDDGIVPFACSSRDTESLLMELNKTRQELESCRCELQSCLQVNECLTRTISNLQAERDTGAFANDSQHSSIDHWNTELSSESSYTDTQIYGKRNECSNEQKTNHSEEILNLQLELDILKIILAEEKAFRTELEERTKIKEHNSENERVLSTSKQYEELEDELKDTKTIIEAFESEQFLLINEMEEVREKCNQQAELLKQKEHEISLLRDQLDLCSNRVDKLSLTKEEEMMSNIPSRHHEHDDSPLQMKLRKMHTSLEKAKDLNMRYQNNQVFHTSNSQEIEEVRREVEIETTEVIVCLQEELVALSKQAADSKNYESITKQRLMELETECKDLQARLCLVTQENEKLGKLVEEKDRKIRSLSEDWERLAYEISDILADGDASLEEAADQVVSISDSIQQRSWICEQVGRMSRGLSERDLHIEELHKCLKEAQNIRYDMEWKLRSLRGAALAISEAQQQESCDKEREILRLTSEITNKELTIIELENRIKDDEEQIKKAELRATVAFITVNKLSEKNEAHLQEIKHVKFLLDESKDVISKKDTVLHRHISLHTDAKKEIQDLSTQLKQYQEYIAELQQLSGEQNMRFRR
ncbi:hypothetical protein Cni_G00355 [Canna indica]|uniref:Kinesin motor domain-containing protein n=1 Tax=Canna indica TaxID=4628 RepID=A0AAQ3JMM6_9LILI|nr:hypothetical protein Cni_G00355 [Canna indica]